MRNSTRRSAGLPRVLAAIVALALHSEASAEEIRPQDLQPSRITKDDAGNWVAAWSTYDWRDKSGADADILVSRSADSGATWTTPVPLNTNAASDWGVDLWPQVATDKAGNWLALWNSNDDLGGTTGSHDRILVARSTDNGATWTDPTPLNRSPAPDLCYGAPKVTTDTAGNWLAVWHCYGNQASATGTDADIVAVRSTDNGATWTLPAPVNKNAATDTAEDVHPRLTTDNAGNWVVEWYSSEWDCDDSLGRPTQCAAITLIARSTDQGVTWSAPVKKEESWVEALANWWNIPREARPR